MQMNWTYNFNIIDNGHETQIKGIWCIGTWQVIPNLAVCMPKRHWAHFVWTAASNPPRTSKLYYSYYSIPYMDLCCYVDPFCGKSISPCH